MAFSASDAAFEGFRVVRRRPLALVFWALAYLVIYAATFALAGPAIVSMGAQAEAIGAADPASFEAFEPLLRSYMALVAVVMPVALVLGAVLYAAVARAVLRPTESSFGYMRLGMDEVRVVVVSIALALLMLTTMVVGSFIVGLVGGFGSAVGVPALWFVAVLLGLALAAAIIWLAVRLSLAVPITVAERRIAIFDSFALTRGKFWPLLGMALLAGVLSLVVGLLSMVVTLPLRMAMGGFNIMQQLEGQDLTQMIQAAWPSLLAIGVANSIVAALQLAVVYAPFSAAYRELTPHRPDTARVFD
jgi:hypothetical protein